MCFYFSINALRNFMKIPIFICCLILFTKLSAQEISKVKAVISVKDLYTLSVPAIDISDSQIIDSTIIKIKYQFNYQIAPEAPVKNSLMILAVGKTNVKFYNSDYYHRDSMYSFKLKNMISSYSCEETPCEELFYKMPARTITTFNRIPNGPSAVITYNEPIPKIHWIISDKPPRDILGYSCFSATGIYGGREWTAWFTDDIPISLGPWKLNGLPGIILHAEERTGCYKFECESVSNFSEPINWFKCRYLNVEKLEWRKTDKAAHIAPLEQLSNDGEILYFYKNKRLDSTWSIPYNPIELE